MNSRQSANTAGHHDWRLAKIVKSCQDLPGYELFQNEDENGEYRSIESADVNDYLREISGSDFSAKEFRTWAGTVIAAIVLKELGAAGTEKEARDNIVTAVNKTAEQRATHRQSVASAISTRRYSRLT